MKNLEANTDRVQSEMIRRCHFKSAAFAAAVWRCGRPGRIPVRDHARGLVCGVLLGIDALPDAAGPGAQRRDGCRGSPDGQRTPGSTRAAEVDPAGPWQAGADRGRTGKDTGTGPAASFLGALPSKLSGTDAIGTRWGLGFSGASVRLGRPDGMNITLGVSGVWCS